MVYRYEDDDLLLHRRRLSHRLYDGPVYVGPEVVIGRHAELHWEEQRWAYTVPPRTVHLAATLIGLLAVIPDLGLPDLAQLDLQDELENLLLWLTNEDHEDLHPETLPLGAKSIKALLAPVLSGTGPAVADETTELIRSSIERLEHEVLSCSGPH